MRPPRPPAEVKRRKAVGPSRVAHGMPQTLPALDRALSEHLPKKRLTCNMCAGTRGKKNKTPRFVSLERSDVGFNQRCFVLCFQISTWQESPNPTDPSPETRGPCPRFTGERAGGVLQHAVAEMTCGSERWRVSGESNKGQILTA